VPETSRPELTAPLLTPLMLSAARDLAKQLDVRAVLVYADAFADCQSLSDFVGCLEHTEVVLATRDPSSCDAEERPGVSVIGVPDVRLSRVGQVKAALLLAVSRQLIRQGDHVLCLAGVAGSGVLDSLFVTTVSEQLELFAKSNSTDVPRTARIEVFERALDIAMSLGAEGREGRPVGTAFVIGDTEAVLRHSDQLILNPFHGYPEDERNVLDPRLLETLKEFSTFDGAFIIRDDGVLETAGRYLRSTIPGEPLPRGLGARHQSAAAITAATHAVAITVSESTGNVTVYEQGHLLFEIEKPRPAGIMPQGTDIAPAEVLQEGGEVD